MRLRQADRRRRARQLFRGRQEITALYYPADAWEESWEGHTEFAPRLHRDAEEANTTARETAPIALRVLPRPRRLVLFHGGILHRASLPSAPERVTDAADAAGATGVPPGRRERLSLVMQLYCDCDRSLASRLTARAPSAPLPALDATLAPIASGPPQAWVWRATRASLEAAVLGGAVLEYTWPVLLLLTCAATGVPPEMAAVGTLVSFALLHMAGWINLYSFLEEDDDDV